MENKKILAIVAAIIVIVAVVAAAVLLTNSNDNKEKEDTNVSVTGVTLNTSSLSLKTGATGKLVATVAPSNATDKSVSWSSSNTGIATVSNGTVKAIAVGTATITVKTTDGSHTATCSVTVSDDVTVSSLDDTLLKVLGNANGDMVIDSKDIKIIQSLAAAGTKVTDSNRLADANNDGVIDSKDVDVVNKIVNKQSTTVYYQELYEGLSSNIESVEWPMKVETIGVYQYQAGILLNFLGLWDKVTYADDTTIGSTNYFDTSGVKSYGAYSNKIMRNTDGLEMFYNSNVDVLVLNGYYDDNEVKNGLAKMGSKTQVIKPYSQGTYCLGSVVTFGFLLGSEKAASEYIDFYNGVDAYLDNCFKNLKSSEYKTFLMPTNPDDVGKIYIDTAGDNGVYPDVAWVLTLPTINLLPVGDNNRYEAVRSAEWFIQPENSADYLLLSMYGLSKKTPANDVAATLDAYKDVFKETTAYKNGNIVGFNYAYENGMFAPGMIALIAAYMYPELVSEDKAWGYFTEFFNKYDKNGAEAAKVYAGVYKIDGGEQSKTTKVGKALVYGNANNDNYLDDEDLDLIKKIVSSGSWDSEEYPFADANYDGKVDQSDVTYLQNMLNKQKAKMYYVDGFGNVSYFNYPAADRKIAASSDYGLMLAQILGIYDRIVAGSSDRVLTYSESRYPGCQSLMSLGPYTSSDYATFVENFLASGCTILLGQITQSVYDMLRDTGKEVDLILLSSSAEIQSGSADVVSSILTAGILLDCGDNARAYAEYFNDITEKLSVETSGVEEKEYLLIYNPSNPTTCTIHTSDGNGGWKGDAWTLSHLPLYTEFEWNGTAKNGKSNGVEIETVMNIDPEIIIFSIWNKAKDDTPPSEVQAIVDEMAQYFSQTSAYKNGKIYAVNYESYGTYLGVGGAYLLASYIWPESFDEQIGWERLQYAVDTFTLIDDDVHNLGGIIPYRVNTTS